MIYVEFMTTKNVVFRIRLIIKYQNSKNHKKSIRKDSKIQTCNCCTKGEIRSELVGKFEGGSKTLTKTLTTSKGRNQLNCPLLKFSSASFVQVFITKTPELRI